MGRRFSLHQILRDLVGSDAVYFQPPPNLQMAPPPCIVYKLDNARTEFAGNVPYRFTPRYQVTIISRDPDTDIFAKVAALPSCIFNRGYVANNLHHYVFVLYF